MLKKILATALAAAMIFAMAGTVFAASPFPDTAGVSNEAVIARLKALGIVKGDDLGNFNPNNPITRAEFTTMVVRMLGLEAAASYVASPTAFPDVTAASAWAYGYINIAINRGLIKGYEDGTFRPSNNVTQAEALTILLRALGYTDNLPGTWPIDYIMKGAELGVISTGFAADTAATRMLIATLVNNTLDEDLVKEDTTASGAFVGFVDKYVAPTSLYEDAFDVTGATYLTGVVSNVDTTNGKITIGTNPATDYVSGVVIYGKDTLAELNGQTVKATLNDDGDIIFITVTTKQEVVGDITAVDTANLKATVGGTAYTVLATATVVKNGSTLTDSTTVAGALAAVKDASATLLLDSNGKVYRIVASILNKDAYIASKSTEVTASGTTTNKMTMKTGDTGTYSFTANTVIVRNGGSATFADLKVDDSVKFSANASNELIYVDAFANVVEGYKVTSYVATTDGANLVTTKDGVETTFAVAKDSNGALMVASTAVTLGNTYKLTLGRDGKVTAVTAQTTAAPTTAKVKTLASKDQYLVESVLKSRFNFSDGTSLVVDSLTRDADVLPTRNGIALADNAVATIWAAAQPGDLYLLTDADTDTQYEVNLWAPSVSGWMFHDNAAGVEWDFRVVTADYTAPYASATHDKARFTTDWNIPLTVNGTAVLPSAVEDFETPDGTRLITVTFGGTTAVKPTSVKIEKFVDATAYPVKAITSTDDGYAFELDLNLGSDATKFVITDEDTKFVKAGAAVAPADIKIGDKLQVDVWNNAGGTTVAAYVKVTADTKAPAVVTAAPDAPVADFTEVGAGTVDTLVVTFVTNEACSKAYIWVGSVQYAATYDNATDKWTSPTILVDGDPGKVSISVTDYAGNVSTSVDVTTT